MTSKILPFTLLCFCLLVMPKSLSSDLPDKNVELSLTPLACFVKTIGDVCHLTIKVNWQALTPINACLYQGVQKVYCWSDTMKAAKKVNVSLSENMVFSLRDDNNKIYTQQLVAIAASTSKRFRRRLRADWSLF